MNGLRGDPRLRLVEWHDLMTLTTAEKAKELLLSVPWLVGSIVLFQLRWYPLAIIASFIFFLTGLRQAHGAQHYSLGLRRRAQDCVLAVLSILMLTSLHALQATHMHHHRHPLEDSDMEAATARMPWWKAIVTGVWFIVALNRRGYELAKAGKRTWIRFEIAAIVVHVTAVLLWAPAGIRWFVLAMLAGECLTGFFAVWTVHHDCDPEQHLARTQRGWWKTSLTYQMFYHVEHHLFPAVPTPRLPELARRLDRVMPQLSERQVF